MVLKKLGGELLPELVSVIEHLGRDLGLRAVVEPHDYELLVRAGGAERAALRLRLSAD